jgi:hypothetical protein
MAVCREAQATKSGEFRKGNFPQCESVELSGPTARKSA